MRPTFILAALLLTAACRTDESSEADTIATVAPAAERERAVQAAQIANAIDRAPESADSILNAAGYTPDSFERLMYDIAADSADAAAFAAARTR